MSATFDSVKNLLRTNATLELLKDQLKDKLSTLRPRKKKREQLRAQWGKPGSKIGFLADRYFELTAGHAHHATVDDKTWTDLEFPQIFERMDTTVSLAGSQILYDRLRKLDTDPAALEQRLATARKMAADSALRESIQMQLSAMEGRSCRHLADYLFGKVDDTPRHKSAWFLWSLIGVATFIATLMAYLPAWVWMLVLAINFSLIVKSHWRVSRDNEAMIASLALLDAADALGAMHASHPDIQPLTQLHARKKQRSGMRRTLRWLTAPKREPGAWLSIWLNFFCVAELLLHACTIDRFLARRMEVRSDFELVGELDAGIAIASFLSRYHTHCQPQLTDARRLSIIDGCHPLLPDGVTNTIRLEQRSALVTGSNMAGKTTFIKMLGTNTVLAQTLGLCLATSAIIPRADVLASIQGNHSVASGKSHYFAEVERIKSFFDTAHQKQLNLLIIDELFSGTNTIERIAIARSVLEALARNAIVLATTHDVELQAILNTQYDCHHFQEDPDVDGYFDYRLRPGATRARNAIRLLAEMGFSQSVIAKAMAYAAQSTTPTAPSVE